MDVKDFVTFEQAVLLNKLGFDKNCTHNYHIKSQQLFNNVYYPYEDEGVDIEMIEYSYNTFKRDTGRYIDAPTMLQVHSWLRNEKNYSIEPQSESIDRWTYRIINFITDKNISETNDVYESYEDALSNGITECLRHLENKWLK